MKTSKTASLLKLLRVSTGFVLALVLFCSICSGQETVKQGEMRPSGSAAETLTFWEAFNKAAASGIGIEAFNGPAWRGNVGLADTCAVLQDIIDTERARTHAITSLPVLHVDPDLAQYAAEFAETRMQVANALLDCVALVKKQEQITSGPVLGVGLLLNLLNHSQDKEDGILWRSMLDEGRQTAERLQALREPAQAVESEAASVRDALGRLTTDEMRLRIKLAQRFDREFPPHDFNGRPSKIAEHHLSKRQIIQSLKGRQPPFWPTWTFGLPAEYVTFKILSIENPNQVRTDYDVKTHVKGLHTGEEHDFAMRLTYGWLYTHWTLIGIQEIR